MKIDYSHDSFFGFTNLFRRQRIRGEWRTPYPVIILNPTFKQVLWNWNRADSGLFYVVMFITYCGTRISIRQLSHESFRQAVFFNNLTLAGMISIYFGMINSYKRLIGEVENGLKWERPLERSLAKYDIAHEMEYNTFWGIFAPKD